MRYFPHQQFNMLFGLLAIRDVDHNVGDALRLTVETTGHNPPAS